MHSDRPKTPVATYKHRSRRRSPPRPSSTSPSSRRSALYCSITIYSLTHNSDAHEISRQDLLFTFVPSTEEDQSFLNTRTADVSALISIYNMDPILPLQDHVLLQNRQRPVHPDRPGPAPTTDDNRLPLHAISYSLSQVQDKQSTYIPHQPSILNRNNPRCSK